jgi:hypothetical protein
LEVLMRQEKKDKDSYIGAEGRMITKYVKSSS